VPPQPRPRTRLYERRTAAGLSQRRLAELTGISLRTLQRIERLEMDNPPLRYLANCAIALSCELEDLIEPEWREWKAFDEGARRPPGSR
jgi:transcriptional regulator with XRE-family HTH domain